MDAWASDIYSRSAEIFLKSHSRAYGLKETSPPAKSAHFEATNNQHFQIRQSTQVYSMTRPTSLNHFSGQQETRILPIRLPDI